MGEKLDVNWTEMQTHYVSKVYLDKSEGFERRAGEPDGRLDVFFQELLHVHPKERPGLLQHLNTEKNRACAKASMPHLDDTLK